MRGSGVGFGVANTGGGISKGTGVSSWVIALRFIGILTVVDEGVFGASGPEAVAVDFRTCASATEEVWAGGATHLVGLGGTPLA